MRSADLADLIDIHGAAIDRWPAADRQRAEALLARSAEARALLDEAAAIEAALRLPPQGADAVTAARVDRVIAAVLAQARVLPQAPARPLLAAAASLACRLLPIGRGWWQYSLPMALGAVLGILAGYHAMDPAPASLPQGEGAIAWLLEALSAERLFGS